MEQSNENQEDDHENNWTNSCLNTEQADQANDGEVAAGGGLL